MFPVHYLPEKLRHMENVAVKHKSMDAVENIITFDSKYMILIMYLYYSLRNQNVPLQKYEVMEL